MEKEIVQVMKQSLSYNSFSYFKILGTGMKKLLVIICAGTMLSACTYGPKKDEPLGLKAGMTIEDVRSRIQLKDEEPSIFNNNETTAKADKIDTDVAQPKIPYAFTFHEGKLKGVFAYYSGQEDIEKVENYLNQVTDCERIDEENQDGIRDYDCYYHGTNKGGQQLANFFTFKSPIKDYEPWLTIVYMFME